MITELTRDTAILEIKKYLKTELAKDTYHETRILKDVLFDDGYISFVNKPSSSDIDQLIENLPNLPKEFLEHILDTFRNDPFCCVEIVD